jgi:hypothetical protein
MIGLLLCFLGFVVTYWMAGRSLGKGFVALLAFSYPYALIRAQVRDVGSHFIFDVALLGFYLGGFFRPTSDALKLRSQAMTTWAVALMVWPLVCVAYSPLMSDAQPIVVQLVGLRDSVMMIPCIILGARMTREDADVLAPGIAILNLLALGVAVLEYVYGVEAFVPESAATKLIYQSHDIMTSGGNFYRIPSMFASSHLYGGTMVVSVPFVAHGLESGRNVRILSWAGLGAAVVGTFLCGARLPVVMLAAATAYVLGSLRMRFSTIFAFALAAGAVAYLVTNLERFQRFTTLSDGALVRDRIGLSVSLSFFDVLGQYPFGVGLASAFGTSIPYFLQDTPGIRGQIGIENEYGRIVLEEGIAGLALWVSFIVYSTIKRREVLEVAPTADAYIQAIVALTWLIAVLGCGTLYSVPTTVMVFIGLGIRLATAPARAPGTLRIAGTPPARVAHGAAQLGRLAVQRASR